MQHLTATTNVTCAVDIHSSQRIVPDFGCSSCATIRLNNLTNNLLVTHLLENELHSSCGTISKCSCSSEDKWIFATLETSLQERPCWLVATPLSISQKTIRHIWVDCHDIWYHHSWPPEDEFKIIGLRPTLCILYDQTPSKLLTSYSSELHCW